MFENAKINNLLNLNLSFKLKNFSFFLFLVLIQIKRVLLNYFESFQSNILNSDSSFIDITDYNNLYPIITLDKKIYIDIPPKEKNITSKLSEISSAVTYNEKFILIACTEEFLLSKINVETGEETPLVSYKDINMNIPNCSCSLSSKDNYVYIGVSHIIIPYIKIKINENNVSRRPTAPRRRRKTSS